MAHKTVDDIRWRVGYWLNEITQDKYTTLWWHVRLGNTGLELRLETYTVWRSDDYSWRSGWIGGVTTNSKQFWNDLSTALSEAHRAIAAFKLQGKTPEAEDIAAAGYDDDIPF